MTEKKGKSPRGPRSGGGGARRGRDRDVAAPARDGKSPPRKEWRPKEPGEARDGVAKRARAYASGESGNRAPSRKPRAQDDERDAKRSARPPREGGAGAGYRRDRFASAPSGERPPRRAERDGEGAKRRLRSASGDFAACRPRANARPLESRERRTTSAPQRAARDRRAKAARAPDIGAIALRRPQAANGRLAARKGRAPRGAMALSASETSPPAPRESARPLESQERRTTSAPQRAARDRRAKAARAPDIGAIASRRAQAAKGRRAKAKGGANRPAASRNLRAGPAPAA